MNSDGSIEGVKIVINHDVGDAPTLRLIAIVLVSSLLMLTWFYFHPLVALLSSAFVLLVSVIGIWPPHIRSRDDLEQKVSR